MGYIKNVETILQNGSKAIVEIIDAFVKLDKKGINHQACCPFHKEKTPSFSVSANKGIFKCFGCGQGGDVIKFLMESEGMDYVEALEYVARYTNTTIEYEQGQISPKARKEAAQKRSRNKDLIKVLNETYNKIPSASVAHVEKWLGRKYSKKTIETFGIKQCDSEAFWKIPKEDLRDIGLLSKADRLLIENRLIFPFHSLGTKDSIRGLAGRQSKDSTGNIKYINQAETEIYKKGELLYGLKQAMQAIRKQDFVRVAEGYTDVWAMHENGLENSIGKSGKFLTDYQCKEIKRFTLNVVLFPDNDADKAENWGIKAAKHNIEKLLKNGLYPSLVILPDNEDPDSYIRKVGEKEFIKYEEENKLDGLVWLSSLDWDEENLFKQNSCREVAAQLISYLPTEGLRLDYINKLSKLWGNNTGKILKEEVKKAFDKKLTNSNSPLSLEQQNDQKRFGVYVHNNQFWITNSLDEMGYPISNFVARRVILVRGKTSKTTRRIIEIENVDKTIHVIDVLNADVYDMSVFGKKVSENGDFVFYASCKPEYYVAIKRYLFYRVPVCYPVESLGWHPKGFYTFGNGIAYQGQFYPVSKYGVVSYEDKQYYLPAWSAIEDTGNDEDAGKYKVERLFSHYPGPTWDFTEWSRRMADVHKENGMVTVAFYLASLFRPILFEKFNCFPILFFFGEPGKGKSFCRNHATCVFGKQAMNFDLNGNSDVAFYIRLKQKTGALVAFEEYNNEISKERLDAIKGSYDGSGRMTADTDDTSKLKVREVNGSLMLNGQQMPSADPALFERSIVLKFARATDMLTPQEVRAGEELDEMSKTGKLSQITVHLTQYWSLFEDQFEDCFNNVRRAFQERLREEGFRVKQRIINNYSMILAATRLISTKEQLGFSYKSLYEFCYQNCLWQFENMAQENDTGRFWDIMQVLIEKGFILEDQQYRKRWANKLTLYDRKDRKNSIQKEWENPQHFFMLSMSTAYAGYAKYMKDRNQTPLSKPDIMNYLEGHPAYVGERKNEKFGEVSRMVVVFDLEKLPLEITYTPDETDEMTEQERLMTS